MINQPPPYEGLNIRIPIIIPIKGRGFINHGSGLWVGGTTFSSTDGFGVPRFDLCVAKGQGGWWGWRLRHIAVLVNILPALHP